MKYLKDLLHFFFSFCFILFEKSFSTSSPWWGSTEAGHTALAAAQVTVPRKSGTLAASAGVSSEVGDHRVTAVVAYKDVKAAAVHEGIHHGHKVNGTRGFKWLEHSFKLAKPKMLDGIVKALRALTGG